MHDTWLKIAGAGGAKVYSGLVALALLVVTARLLGPDGRGVIAVATTWVLLVATLGSLSLGNVVLHRATAMRGRPWLGPSLGSLLALAGLVTLGGSAVALGLYTATDGRVFQGVAPAVLLVAFLALPFHVWERYGSSLLMALDRLAIHNRALVAGRTAGLALAAVLLWAGAGAVGVLAALLVGQIVIAAAGMRFLFTQAGPTLSADASTMRQLAAGGLKLHLTTVGGLLISSADVLLVNHFRGLAEAGQYQLAMQLVAAALLLPQAASMVLYGQVASLGPDEAWAQQRRIVATMTAGMALVALAAAVLAPWALPLAVGAAFAPAIPVFRLLLLSLVGMSFSTVMAAQWIGRGMFWQTSAITLSVGLLNVIGNLILIPEYGMHGAAWASVGSTVAGVMAHAGMAVWLERRRRSHAA